MNCPNCKHEAPSGAVECPACGIIFAKWQRLQDEKIINVPALGEALPPPPATEGLPSSVKMLLLGAIGVAAYLALAPSRGGTPPSGAYMSEKYRFAFAPPEGWKFSTAEQCGGPAGSCLVAAADKEEAEGRAKATFQVFAAPMAPQRIRESDKEEVGQKFLSAFAAQMDKSSVESSSIAAIDGLPAIKMVLTGSKHVREVVTPEVWATEDQAAKALAAKNPGQTSFAVQVRYSGKPGENVGRVLISPGEYREVDYQLVAGGYLVFGKKNMFLVNFAYDKGLRSQYEPAIDAAAASLRILDRPGFLDYYGGVGGSVASDAILGAIIGVFLIVLRL